MNQQSIVTGKARTVLGDISPESLGITLPHEHLFIDATGAMEAYKPTDAAELALYYEPVKLENLWWITYHPGSNRDNLTLKDEEIAIKESSFFKLAGGSTIVDPTNADIGRDPQAMVRVAKETGLNVIVGTGRYIASSHPSDMHMRSEADICEEIVSEITTGTDNTTIRAGIIGEIGCSWPLLDSERKVLRAAAQAQKRTGAPLTIHPGRAPKPDVSTCLEIVDILSKAGADISKTVFCHIERTITDHKGRCMLAETGCYLEWDIFGWEGYHNVMTVDMPNDSYRINQIMDLAGQGYIKQVLISQDICWKNRLRSYGGHGYDHILRNVVPVMRAKGISQEIINTLLIENPKRMLTF